MLEQRMTSNAELCNNLLPLLFAGRVFRLVHNSTHNSLQAYVSFRPATLLQCDIPPTWRLYLL